MDQPKKGAYENVYMQEMFEAVNKAPEHRQKGVAELQKIGKSSKGASKVVRFFLFVGFLVVIGLAVALLRAEPQYTYVIGAFLGVFVLFSVIVSFLRR